MSWITLAFVCFIDKRYLISAVLIVLTYFTHPTMLCFLIAFVLYLLRDFKGFIPLVIVGFVMVFFAGEYLLSSMVQTLDNEHFYAYLNFSNRYTYTTFIFYTVIFVLCLIGYNSYMEYDTIGARIFYGFSLMACGFQAFASISPSAFRLSLPFVPFLAILVPNSLEYMTNHRNVIKYVMMGCMIFYFLYANRDSTFTFSF